MDITMATRTHIHQLDQSSRKDTLLTATGKMKIKTLKRVGLHLPNTMFTLLVLFEVQCGSPIQLLEENGSAQWIKASWTAARKVFWDMMSPVAEYGVRQCSFITI